MVLASATTGPVEPEMTEKMSTGWVDDASARVWLSRSRDQWEGVQAVHRSDSEARCPESRLLPDEEVRGSSRPPRILNKNGSTPSETTCTGVVAAGCDSFCIVSCKGCSSLQFRLL